MGKKFVFYLKGGNRAITMTDHKESRSLKDLQEVICEMLNSTLRVPLRFTTSTDCLVLHPDEIGGVHIQEITNAGERYDGKISENWAQVLEDPEEGFSEVVVPDIVEEKPQKTTPKAAPQKKESFIDINLEEDDDDDIQIPGGESILGESSGSLDIEKTLMESIEEAAKEAEDESDKDTPTPEPAKKKKPEANVVQTHTPEKPKGSVITSVSNNVAAIQMAQHQMAQQQMPQQRPEISDPTMVFSHPGAINNIPEMGKANQHIFQRVREDGTPIPVSSNATSASQVLGDVIRKASARGKMTSIKPVPLKRT